jgi:light-regulated signal transduction histidine kinase (bacteriophytochrome)
MTERAAIPAAPEFGAATLNDCDREPIHLSGSVQEHGCLITVNRDDGRVEMAGGDFERILGLGRDAVLGGTLAGLVGETDAARLLSLRSPVRPSPLPLKTFELELTLPAGKVDAIIHEFDGRWIIEFEQARRTTVGMVNGSLFQVQWMLATLDEKRTVDSCCQTGAQLMHDLTGFARVMIYQFQSDGSGKVIAEAKTDDMESYLGLHFPESDIPKQARALYRSNWLRYIPDVDYRPQPIEPQDRVKALDLSFSMFRSVSPIHVQYLKNMGVGASMSISIIIQDRLWGLIACHHPAPHMIPCDVRAVCEVFGQAFSLQVESRLHAEDYEYRLQQRGVHAQLVRRLSSDDDLATGLTRYRPNLLDYIHAEGVAIVVDGQFSDFGRTPGRSFVHRLIGLLNEINEGVFATNRLADLLPEAEEHAAEASGILALSVSRSPKDYVIWFRPEVIETVTWAGNPNKAVLHTDPGNRLQPRQSFAAWRETVKGKSREWKDVEIEAAHALRLSILEVVLNRIDQVARERARHAERQNILVSELDHRVKNVMANIQALMRFTRGSSDSIETYIEDLEKRINAMAYAHSLLSQSRWEGAELRAIIEEEMAQYTSDDRPQATIKGENVNLPPKTALSLSLVIHELATNAAKHGALSGPGGHVMVNWQLEPSTKEPDLVLDWVETGGPPVEPPTRKGFGRQLIETGLRYELGASVDLQFLPAGVQCRLCIPSDQIGESKPGSAEGEAFAGVGKKNALRVLVVEDSMITAMDIERILETAGHSVSGPTGRVEEALSLLQEETIDLALLDINLGKDNSFLIAERLEDLRIPFLFLSGYTPDKLVPERFADRPFLGKPFSDQGLAEIMRTTLARAKAHG